MTIHTKTVCKNCGVVISQCRCICNDKVMKYGTCKKCLENPEEKTKNPPNFKTISFVTCLSCCWYTCTHSQIEGNVDKKCSKYGIKLDGNTVCDDWNIKDENHDTI